VGSRRLETGVQEFRSVKLPVLGTVRFDDRWSQSALSHFSAEPVSPFLRPSLPSVQRSFRFIL
jgi:hypothetical protein